MNRNAPPLPDRCPACGATPVGPFVEVSRSWDVVQCPACTHVFCRDAGSTVPGDNDHFEQDGYADWRNRNLDWIRARVARGIDLLIAETGCEPGKVLEIGCSTGEALQELVRRGWRACGVDLSETAIRLGLEAHSGLPLSVGTERDVLQREGPASFDLVMAFHVVEHIPDLGQFMRNLQALCKPGGYLYLCLPHYDAWSRRVMGDQWPDFMTEHFHYFTKQSMRAWLEQGTFSVVHEGTRGSAWQWLGGFKRKLTRPGGVLGKRERGARSKSMPRAGSMRLLRTAGYALLPLLKLEELAGSGSELRIIARRG